MEIRPEQVYTLSPDVLFQEVSGEVVLLDLASESYFGLDEVGARIWLMLSEGQAVGTVLDKLEAEFEVTREVLERDVAELLVSLLDAGLVRP